jgi:hypothetical protein
MNLENKMNIFFLSMSIKRCAKAHINCHVIKMILEYIQILSTAWHMLNPELANKHFEDGCLYKKTHMNHPCNIWIRQHINNYHYVASLALQLCEEWRYRYQHDRVHGSENILGFLYQNPPPNINQDVIKKSKSNPKSLSLPLPKAMPDECKVVGNDVHSCVLSYRKYYKSSHKAHIISWTVKDGKTRKPLEKPYWW